MKKKDTKLATKKKSSKLTGGKKSFLKNPAFLVIAAVFIAVGVFLTFNTFAANSPTAASGTKDTSPPYLYIGTSGPWVARAQRDIDTIVIDSALNNGRRYTGQNGASCYSAGPQISADGQFGSATQAAVIRVQQGSKYLGVDGVIGSSTWKYLFNCAFDN